MSTRIFFELFIGLFILSRSLCSIPSLKTVVRKSKAIMITKNIRECMKNTSKFSDKFIRNVDYIQIPTKKQLSHSPLSRTQISIIAGCKSSNSGFGIPIQPSANANKNDLEMIQCIKQKSYKKVSSKYLQDLHKKCVKNSKKCVQWRGEVKYLSNMCDEEEEDKDSLGCIINECKKESVSANQIFSM